MPATNQIDLPETMMQSWQDTVDLLAKLVDVPSAILTRVTPPYIEVFKSADTPDNPYPAGARVELANHYCEFVVNNKKRLLLPNAHKDPDWQNAPEIGINMISYLGYPLFWPDGDIFGTLCVLDSEENQYSDDIETLMVQFGALVEAHLALLADKQIIAEKNRELEARLEQINDMQTIIPICAECYKVRTDEGFWEQVDSFFTKYADYQFSHGLCPECFKKYHDEIG